jgi:hypothetical protein
VINQAPLQLSQRHEVLMPSHHSTVTCSHSKTEIIVPVMLICECTALLPYGRSRLVSGLIRSRKVAYYGKQLQESCFPRKISERTNLLLHSFRKLEKYLLHIFPTDHRQTIYTLYHSPLHVSA